MKLQKDVKTSTIPVNKEYFIAENIIEQIREEKRDLKGIETLCYIIKTHSQATEHKMGPWCPTHLEDGKEKAGSWFDNGKVYDVSGHFIAKLDEFYSDKKWKLYREDGSIKVTDTKEGCLAAAKPDVEEAYKNHCVECLPDYFKNQITTFVIPVKPMYLISSRRFGRGGLELVSLSFQRSCNMSGAPIIIIISISTIAIVLFLSYFCPLLCFYSKRSKSLPFKVNFKKKEYKC